jgi:hypothetical protein
MKMRASVALSPAEVSVILVFVLFHSLSASRSFCRILYTPTPVEDIFLEEKYG